jgi:hypothetical protein
MKSTIRSKLQFANAALAATLAGTGKYEGLQMGGTSVPLGSFPSIKPGTFQACNRQTGTYKLK